MTCLDCVVSAKGAGNLDAISLEISLGKWFLSCGSISSLNSSVATTTYKLGANGLGAWASPVGHWNLSLYESVIIKFITLCHVLFQFHLCLDYMVLSYVFCFVQCFCSNLCLKLLFSVIWCILYCKRYQAQKIVTITNDING